MKEFTNAVVIEGILSEVGLEKATYTDKKSGSNVDCIRGDIKVRVQMPIVKGGDVKTLEVPIRFYSNKYNKAGNESAVYTGLEKFMTEAKSISAVGEADADCVRITGGRLKMQEYWTPDGRFITYPSIEASFINFVNKSELDPKANANVQLVVGSMKMVTDKDGVETGSFIVNGAVVGYNGYTDVIPFVTDNASYISAINATYKEGDVIEIAAKLNFSSKTEVTYEEVEIGDPIEKRHTVNISDLVIYGVKSADINSEDIDEAELRNCLAARTARIEDKKKSTNSTTERTKATEQQKKSLGF